MTRIPVNLYYRRDVGKLYMTIKFNSYDVNFRPFSMSLKPHTRLLFLQVLDILYNYVEVKYEVEK